MDTDPDRTIILNRGDYTSLTINLCGGRVTSWRIQNREQLFVSRIACFSHLTRLWGGIGLSFPHFAQWNFGPDFGFAKNMIWFLEAGPHYLENGDVWATLFLKDDFYTQSIWNFKFLLHFTVTLHEFKLSFEICVENYDNNFTFDFYFLHHAFFRTPDVKNCEVTGLKNTLYRVNKKNDDNYDEGDILKTETRDVIKITGETETIYSNVLENIEISSLLDNGRLKVVSEKAHDFQLWNPWKNHKVRFMGTTI